MPKLMHPDMVAEFIEEYHRERKGLEREVMSDRTVLEAGQKKVTQQIEQIVTAITEVMFNSWMKTKWMIWKRAKLSRREGRQPILPTTLLSCIRRWPQSIEPTLAPLSSI
ncbi:hypothetical protein [uncultured Tateyamaria sp.]|uniref:hypothetical protein n=1 Tax=uncultured Tateyamaria sp. TaxID=455651 RepID=UPI00260DCF51|nr:hypothetical protein [uncultured Tateyamaria sp.]